MATEKVCGKCKVSKTMSQFDRNRRMSDGFNGRCKTCRKQDSIGYYTKNKEAILEKRRESYQTEHTRSRIRKYGQLPAVKKRSRDRKRSKPYREWQKQYRLRPERIVAEQKRYRENKPKWRAYKAVRNAVVNGTIKPASQCVCKQCGQQARHYHHHSYKPAFWLDVVALCTLCHGNLHSN